MIELKVIEKRILVKIIRYDGEISSKFAKKNTKFIIKN